MEKRSLLAVVLSTLVLVIYFFLVSYYAPPPPPSPQPTASTSPSSASPPPSASSLPSAETLSTPSPSAPPKTTTVDTSIYHLTLNSLNGSLSDFIVKNYRSGVEKKAPPVNLFENATNKNLVLRFHESNLSLPSEIPFTVQQEGNNRVEYVWNNDQVKLTKVIEWDPQNYVGKIYVNLENLSDQTWMTGLGLRVETHQNREDTQGISFLKPPSNLKFPAYYSEKGMTRHQDVSKLDSNGKETGSIQWAGIEDRYFLWALLPTLVSTQNQVLYGVTPGNNLFSEILYPKEAIAPGTHLQREFSVYFGPKEMDRLKLVGAHLDEAIDYGWFGPVARLLLALLKFIQIWVGNWGLTIIALTLIIKLLLHPINKKSMESMKAMQKIQPKLAEIREKYANDRERQNIEMMNLFKIHKVNPMGGCLPMLLQMPVYIALYKVLSNAIELYHAPFFAFYKDLSAPDPYFISPILLGIFMVLQQKMTPSTQDPAQAKMMMLMPIMFSAFMLFLPAGLVLYIFVNTLITVVQQYLHQHDMSLADLMRKMRHR